MNQAIMNLAINRLRQNPQVCNTPMGQQFLKILETGDQNAGIQMANNLLNSSGMSREEAIYQARQRFGI